MERRRALDQLRDHLDLVGLRLRRYVAMHGHRLLQHEGKLSDLYVSMEEAVALSRAHSLFERKEPLGDRVDWPSSAEVERELDARAWDVQRRWGQGEAAEGLPLDCLRRRFGLDDTDVLLLVAAAAPDLSIDLSRFYRFAWADFTRRRPTVGFLAELCADTPTRVVTLTDAFGPDAPLVRHRLVTLGAGKDAESGLLHREVSVPDHVVAALVGREGGLPHALAACCRHHLADDALSPEAVMTAPGVRVGVAGLLERWRRGGRATAALVGPTGIGRRTLVRALAAVQGRAVLELDAALAPPGPDAFEDIAQQALTESILRDVPLLVRLDGVADRLRDDGTLERFARVLGRMDRGCVVALTTSPTPLLMRERPDAAEVVFPASGGLDQLRAWREALAATGLACDADLPDRLALRFQQTPGRIYRSVAAAVRQRPVEAAAEDAPRLTMVEVAAAVRRGSEHHLGAIAEPFGTSLSWSDAVLPPETEEILREVLAHARHRIKVFDEWGLRRMMSYGRGLSCLFYGPPGTGKTMMATVLATMLERELYRVDLSRVTSKWIGETEKNLARLFDEAERAQVILLFDEADSLFSKRMKVGTSTDRSANMQINYLLQRMEAYDGMTVLTTNLESSLDEAFKRRLRFRVHFPKPGYEERLRLWQVMLPSRLPLADDVDLEALADHFELTGGHIKNAVLRAAMYAAEAGGAVTLDQFAKAALAEAREIGMVVRPLPGPSDF